MFSFLSFWNTPQPQEVPKKTHKLRFGIIPSEPCRASSMQPDWEVPCQDKTVS